MSGRRIRDEVDAIGRNAKADQPIGHLVDHHPHARGSRQAVALDDRDSRRIADRVVERPLPMPLEDHAHHCRIIFGEIQHDRHAAPAADGNGRRCQGDVACDDHIRPLRADGSIEESPPTRTKEQREAEQAIEPAPSEPPGLHAVHRSFRQTLTR